ncbi:MAG TPA: HAD-IA family hydrolase [Gemmataceae bacterium]|nr:HAD-IA family hydrolase [Gemmataceae bacterium]
MKPRAVFFDAVGTLIHPDPPAPAVYAAVAQRFGSRLDEAAIAVRFREALRRQDMLDRRSGWRTDEARERDRWRAIVAEALADVSGPDACFEELYTHFARPDAWRVRPEAGPTLRGLADRGVPIGLASNFDSRLRQVAAGFPALAGVRPVVISSEVGWRKPAAQFFHAVRHAADKDANHILYIGDDRVHDYDGARSAGLLAVLFDPQEACPDKTVRRIGRLTDLLSVGE